MPRIAPAEQESTSNACAEAARAAMTEKTSVVKSIFAKAHKISVENEYNEIEELKRSWFYN
jgi:hypothetical protein